MRINNFLIPTLVAVLLASVGIKSQTIITKGGLSGGGSVTAPLLFSDGTAAAPSIAFTSQPSTGIYNQGTQEIRISINGTLGYQFKSTGLQFSDATSSLQLGTNGDLILLRDAANVLAQRNSTVAQAFKVYNTFTTSTNYERLALNWASNIWSIGPEAQTGTVRGGFYNYGPSSVLTITANVIAPINGIHHVGAGLVKTITVPASCTPTCQITIIPDAAYTTDATGNIYIASTAVISRAMIFTYDGTKWSPSY